MTRAGGLVALLLPSESSRRAFEETLADWSEDRRGAATILGRAWTDVRGTISVIRFTVALIRIDLARPDIWRVFAWNLALAIGVSLVNPSLWQYAVHRLQGVEFNEAVLLTALLIPNTLAITFLLACAAGCGQRRDRGRSLAGILVSSVFMLALVGWVVPAANQSFRINVWKATQAAVFLRPAESWPAVPPMPPLPGGEESSLPAVFQEAQSKNPAVAAIARRTLSLRLALLLAVPTAVLFGISLRARFFARRSWRLGQVSGAAGLIAVVIGSSALAEPFLKLFSWPTAVLISRLNFELWLALALTWVAIVVVARSSSSSEPVTEP